MNTYQVIYTNLENESIQGFLVGTDSHFALKFLIDNGYDILEFHKLDIDVNWSLYPEDSDDVIIFEVQKDSNSYYYAHNNMEDFIHDFLLKENLEIDHLTPMYYPAKLIK